MRPLIAVTIAIAMLASGCLNFGRDDEGGTTEVTETFTPPSVSETTGAILGSVADESIEPVANATVELQGTGVAADTTTNADGRFKFEQLAPGAYQVTVKSFDHFPQARSVRVEAGAVSEQTFLLAPLPSTEPWHDDPALHYALFLECQTGFAFTNKPATPTEAVTDGAADAIAPLPLLGADGLADALIRRSDDEWNETSSFGLLVSACSILPESTNNDNFLIQFNDTEPGLQDILLDLDWAPRGGTAEVMRLVIEPCLPPEEYNETDADGMTCYYNSGYAFESVNGPSPLAAHISTQDLQNVTKRFNENETAAGDATGEETAKGFDVAKPQDFTKRAWFVVRLFTHADQLGPGAPADYALSFQQPADLYITRFHYAGMPAGYSGIPDQ